jgi:ubiquinone biosynthesis protein UbiJ
MIVFALSGLEKALNGYLQLDADNLAHLGELEGKTIQFSITDWHITFYICPHDYRLQLQSQTQNPPDTVISGTLFGLLNTAIAGGNSRAVFANAIDISGDIAVGEKIQALITGIDIDWEEHLSKLVGDIAAHKIAVRAKKTVDLGRNTLLSLRENIKEFLQSESQQVPSSLEVDKFLDQVHTLQHDVDRAQARFDHWLLKRKSSR